MKIKKVKWNDHPILGNLELDFFNESTDDPFDTILFAGENGTGKTTILESISTFLNRGSFEYFESIEYIVDGKLYTATPLPDPNIKDFYTMTDDTGTQTAMRSNKNNNPELIDNDRSDIRHHRCVFSKAGADYRTSRITSTTTKSLDSEKYDIDQEDDFTSLKQLIVDIENQDNAEYADINRQLGNSPKPWGDFYLTSKIYRFKNAFDNFFEQIKYEKVTDINSEKQIVFKKNNKDIYIDKLSTGEKQIVFRGIYLLKNSKNLNGAAIMIDEPELSMHPKWQKKSLKYYKDLFTESNSQKAQLFIATHSDHVLKEALGDQAKNTVIVLTEDSSGAIIANKIVAPSVLPRITSAEINYLAFDITSIDYHIELYGWLQDNRSVPKVKDCDNFIKNHPLYRSDIHEKTDSYETTHYKTICTYIRNAIHHPDSNRTYTELEFKISIKLLIDLCQMTVDSTVVDHS